MTRTNFTDRQKAEIYVLDRAICAYSGRSLWILDHGIDAKYVADWADHIQPSSSGGESSVENGVCASWFYNYSKGNGISAPFLFYRGAPTPAFLFIHDQIPEPVASNLHRFRELHFSDWYFNRSVWRFCLGLHWLSDFRRGQQRDRDDKYYAKAAFKFLRQWRSIVSREHVCSLEERGIVPTELTDDQRMLLRVREASGEGELRMMMEEFLPFHEASRKVWLQLEDLLAGKLQPEECSRILEATTQDMYVPLRMRSILAKNLLGLFEFRTET